MKVTLNWLKQYVAFDWSPDQLKERLTMLGVEVEGMETISGEFDGVVVAEIVSSDKHPNADKLSVCKVKDGQGERQIVCGAKNFKVGDKVPLALPGCALPTPAGAPPFTIKVGKLRGVESQGMMCSAKELGLAEDADGLLILPTSAQVGQPLAQHLGRASGDVVYDLEITPNRPDLNSVVGIAREIAALTGNPLKIPAISLNQNGAAQVDETVAVRVENPDLCPRYIARVVRNVKIGPSPAWLKSALEKVGVRSINNVVDVTNFVMLEIGQPLHAFDFRLLASAPGTAVPTIVVRAAAEGEKFTTLDGKERTLTSQMLLIADETKGIALAGVMGGRNTEIQESTSDVLLESACFQPQNIRATSKRLELRTDSSYRFERGCDIEGTEWASRRAAQLIAELAGGVVLEGAVDVYPAPAKPKEITLRADRTERLLGVAIPGGQQAKYLQQLGLEKVAAGDLPEGAAAFRIPSHRLDLKREVDLVEEIARLYGVDQIPSTPPRCAVGSNAFDSVYDQLDQVRRLLTGLGLCEAQGQTLISDIPAKLFAPVDAITPLANPLSADMNVLRPSLAPGLLETLRHNLHRKTNDLALFEVGRVFRQADGAVREERRLAIALTGLRESPFWSGNERDAKMDIFGLKGIVEELAAHLGLRGLAFERRPETGESFIESAVITAGKQVVGELGQIHPLLGKTYDLRDPVLLAELNLDVILARRPEAKSFKQLPAFPSVRRDVAMIVPEGLTNETILATVKQAKLAHLESVELFDVFRGKNLPEGQKSLAYAFIYRNAEKTLTDAEVNTSHDRIVGELKSKLNAVIRDAG